LSRDVAIGSPFPYQGAFVGDRALQSYRDGEYGGAFQQLESAVRPLAIVVPLILAIIGMLLFFALRSARNATVIFSGVPLAHQRRIGFVDPRNSFIDLCAYRISVARNAAR